jgi:hypothetical protein
MLEALAVAHPTTRTHSSASLQFAATGRRRAPGRFLELGTARDECELIALGPQHLQSELSRTILP